MYGDILLQGGDNEYVHDPLVKWLRHRPFTAVTWVRIPYGSY